VPYRILFVTTYIKPVVLIFVGAGAMFASSAVATFAAISAASAAAATGPMLMGLASLVIACTGFAKLYYQDAKDRRRFQAEESRKDREEKSRRHDMANKLHTALMETEVLKAEVAALKTAAADLKRTTARNAGRIAEHDRALSHSGEFPALPPDPGAG
jgi:hypothetical protein